jgi:putative flippase GtrA
VKPFVALYRKVEHLVHEVAKFGLVGAAGMVVDIGVFNLLRYDFGGAGLLHHKPLTARAISIALATLVTYFGNRYWTWRHRERRAMHHEYALFFVLNFAGLVINLAVLGLVNYVLHLSGPLTDNLANLVGIALGTLFRFWSYRRFVFREVPDDPLEEAVEPAGASSGR